ncbi:Uncharacterised protein [Yersinia frederiksenii]|uniref:Uncharacterized protein n=2 Tax=Yersinia frederiksenii TaxID=29484 RepID=A0A380PU62_YERFR|nr:hypothetical protein DJ58_71 [Yersinia frederiksenii ATCC 33641]SUP77164.1 Uncharacterised protein [Yersinia frederiksenii]
MDKKSPANHYRADELIMAIQINSVRPEIVESG